MTTQLKAETCYLGRNLPDQPKFDISYVHMRYNRTAVNEVMHPDHKVSIQSVKSKFKKLRKSQFYVSRQLILFHHGDTIQIFTKK